MKDIKPNTAQGYLEDYEPTDKEVLDMLPIFMHEGLSKPQIENMFDFVKSFLIEKNNKKNR